MPLQSLIFPGIFNKLVGKLYASPKSKAVEGGDKKEYNVEPVRWGAENLRTFHQEGVIGLIGWESGEDQIPEKRVLLLSLYQGIAELILL